MKNSFSVPNKNHSRKFPAASSKGLSINSSLKKNKIN